MEGMNEDRPVSETGNLSNSDAIEPILVGDEVTMASKSIATKGRPKVKCSGKRKRSRSSSSSSPSSSPSSSSSDSSSDKTIAHGTPSPSRKKKRKSKKKCRRRQGTTSDNQAKHEKYELFQTQSEKEKHQWKLPNQLAHFYNKHSRTYIPEKQLAEDIKSDLPVPDNIRDVPKMDDFLSSMIAAANKNYVLENNKDLERIKNKVRDITGPISYLWEKIERFRTGDSNEAMDIEESALTMRKAMMLVGQASNAITYQRRLEVLKGFTDVKTAKGMLGKHAEKLTTEPTESFGKDFKSVLKTTSTDSKQPLEFFHPPSRQKHPFREGSSPAKKNQGKERSFFVRRDHRGSFNQNPRNRGGYPGKLNSQSQHVGNHSHSTDTPSFTEKPLCRGKSKQLFCRESKTIPDKLAKAHKRQKCLKNCEGLGDTSNLKTNPAKSSTHNSILKNRGASSVLGGCQHVKKRNHQNCYTERGPVAEQYFHTSKKGREIQADYKSKNAESICTLPTFQNGGSAGRKENAQQRGPRVQIRSERCLFYRSPKHKLQKTSKISVERETIRVSVPSFWTGASTQDIHKITENPNFNIGD